MASQPMKPTRRAMLRLSAASAPALTALLSAGKAHAFRTTRLGPADALAYRDRCTSDQFHAASLDAAIAKLKAAGIAFDETRLRATLICPICGCPILTAARP